jgi:hypothetical protein
VEFVNKYRWQSWEVAMDAEQATDDEGAKSNISDPLSEGSTTFPSTDSEISFQLTLWDLEDPFKDAIKQTSIVQKAYPLLFSSKRTIAGKSPLSVVGEEEQQDSVQT